MQKLQEEVCDLRAEKKSFWENATKDEIIAQLKLANQELENHLCFWVKEGGIKKYEDLQKENKKLKEEIAHKNEKFSEWIKENKELEEHNKELMDQNKKFYLAHEELTEQKDNLAQEYDEFYDQVKELVGTPIIPNIQKLKEENDELKDGENTALMIDKLNLEFEQEVSKNDVYKSMISGLEKAVQRQDVLIEELREDLRKARETAIHYWSGGDYGECYAQEVIPQNIRAAVEDQ